MKISPIDSKNLFKRRFIQFLKWAALMLFGRNIQIQGLQTKARVFPFVFKGKLKVLGIEGQIVQPFFDSANDLHFTEVKTLPRLDDGLELHSPDQPLKEIVHVILCHQNPETVLAIYNHHAALSGGYRIVIAYGGSRENFDSIDVPYKFYIEDPSLRGPGYLQSHWEMIEKAISFCKKESSETLFFFTEGDLVGLQFDYLREVASQMQRFSADFAGKRVRDITASNNYHMTVCVTHGMDRNPSISAGRFFYHNLGCFIGLRGSFIRRMVDVCRKMPGLYCEILFPTAAALAGGRLLSLDEVGNCLEKVRYRPFFSALEAKACAEEGFPLIHPVKGDEILLAIKTIGKI